MIPGGVGGGGDSPPRESEGETRQETNGVESEDEEQERR